MVDLIDRQAAIERIDATHIFTEPWGEALLKKLPSVDAVPVVRCGECKHMTATGWCSEFADDCIRPSSSDFCSHGERREYG